MRCATLGLCVMGCSWLSGCGDALEGDWQQVPPAGCTSRGEISVNGDLEVSGTVTLQHPVTLNCDLCNITGVVEESENDCYTGSIVLPNCPCDGNPNGLATMCVQDETDELTFLVILQGTCGDRSTVWERL